MRRFNVGIGDPFEYNYLKLSDEYIKDQEYWTRISKDDDPGGAISHGVVERDEYYTELLGNYADLTRKRNKRKEFHKWAFFWIIIASCIVIGFFLIRFVITGAQNLLLSNQFTSDTLVAFVSALASLVSVIISIPLIITKYLFNTAEDDNITKIIMGTQLHDSKEISLLDDRFTKEKKEADSNESAEEEQSDRHNEEEKDWNELEKALSEV